MGKITLKKLASTAAARTKRLFFSSEGSQIDEIGGAVAGMSERGMIITPEASIRFSAVWAAIRLLSEIPASLPKRVEYFDGLRWSQKENDPVSRILNSPNEFMSGFDFHEAMNASLQMYGNALAVIFKDSSGSPTHALPVCWSSVLPVLIDGKVFFRVNDTTFAVNGTFPASDCLHYKILSNGIAGRSPLRHARENVSLALNSEQFGAEYFKTGGHHKAVIETTNEFKSFAEYAAWREKYDNEHTGRTGNHTTPIMPPGMIYKKLSIPLEDAQFIAFKSTSVQDVARWFNVPPNLLADLSKATFSNIENLDSQFVKYTLRSIVEKQEAEWLNKLIPEEIRGQARVKFNLDGFARGGMLSRATFYSSMVNSGVITPNEAREMAGYSHIAGMDSLRIL